MEYVSLAGSSMGSVRATSPYVSTPTCGIALYRKEKVVGVALLNGKSESVMSMEVGDTHLNEFPRSRKAYLFFPATLIDPSCFLRTMRSQITTSFLTL
jgi:hypothetical protein